MVAALADLKFGVYDSYPFELTFRQGFSTQYLKDPKTQSKIFVILAMTSSKPIFSLFSTYFGLFCL